MNPAIRPATEADLPDVIRIERESSTAAHWTIGQYAQLLKTGLVLVATEAGGAIIGFICATAVGPEWEIENIVVAGRSRRQGIAGALLQRLLEQVKAQGGEVVRLEVRESNQPARTFYEGQGFGETGRRRHYYRNPDEDAVLYQLRTPEG